MNTIVPLNKNKYGTVAVLMGGWSAEREISLKGGNEILAALKRLDVKSLAIDIEKRKVVNQIFDCDYDIAFNVLHGRGGEDGLIQALLELRELPYTGSNLLASAITMDKVKTKQLLESFGLPTPRYMLIDENSDFEFIVSSLGLPLVVKPVSEGSSFGMSIVDGLSELAPAFKLAAKYCQTVMVESFIEGIEYTATILGTQVLPIIRLETPRKFYDFIAKYEASSTKYICPCGLNADAEVQLKRLALSAFEALGASGWGRVDLFIDSQNKPWIIEINTVPGMTDHSLVPMAAKQHGLSFDELVLAILDNALISEPSYRGVK